MTLKNLWAASGKRNFHDFGVFPSTMDLFWISDNSSEAQTPVTVAPSTTPVFDIANGTIQRMTLTADVASSTFVLNGGSSIPDGTQFWLHLIQNATGGWLWQMPTTVRNPGSMVVGLDPNVMTTFQFEYRAAGWDIIMAPVEGLAV